jgi:hypothetical protein
LNSSPDDFRGLIGRFLKRERLQDDDLEEALLLCSGKYGRAWVAGILLEAWVGEHDYEAALYGALKPVAIPPGPNDPGGRHLPRPPLRPGPMVEELGAHALSAPSFRRDVRAMADEYAMVSNVPEPHRSRYMARLKADARTMGGGLLELSKGRRQGSGDRMERKRRAPRSDVTASRGRVLELETEERGKLERGSMARALRRRASEPSETSKKIETLKKRIYSESGQSGTKN